MCLRERYWLRERKGCIEGDREIGDLMQNNEIPVNKQFHIVMSKRFEALYIKKNCWPCADYTVAALKQFMSFIYSAIFVLK